MCPGTTSDSWTGRSTRNRTASTSRNSKRDTASAQPPPWLLQPPPAPPPSEFLETPFTAEEALNRLKLMEAGQSAFGITLPIKLESTMGVEHGLQVLALRGWKVTGRIAEDAFDFVEQLRQSRNIVAGDSHEPLGEQESRASLRSSRGKPCQQPLERPSRQVPFDDGDLPQSIFRNSIRHGRTLELQIRERMAVLGSFIDEVRGFEELHADQVLTTPSLSPLDRDAFVLTSPFGSRRSPFTKQYDFHPGIDMAAATGTEIRAPAGTLAGVSGFQIQFAAAEVFTPGDRPDHRDRRAPFVPQFRTDSVRSPRPQPSRVARSHRSRRRQQRHECRRRGAMTFPPRNRPRRPEPGHCHARARAIPPAAAPRCAGPRAPPGIAVLPFEDYSEDGDQEHFSKGIAEEMLRTFITRAQGRKAFVRSHTVRGRKRRKQG